MASQEIASSGPKVSFIIPVYNAEDTIQACIESIRRLDYPVDLIELIVVDNLSTDDSRKIVDSLKVDACLQTAGTISRVRNHGARVANGDFLAFVDSDCLLHANWLNAAIRTFDTRPVAAVGAGYGPSAENHWIEKAWLFEYSGPPIETDFLPGGNFMVRKQIFEEIGGFDEGLITGEDADLFLRIRNIGGPILHLPEMLNVHLGNPKTAGEFFRKEVWYGLNSIDLIKKEGMDRVVLATTLFVIFEIVFLASFLIPGLRSTHFPFFIGLALLLITVFSAVHRAIRSRKFRFLPHMLFLFPLFFNARAFGILKHSLSRE